MNKKMNPALEVQFLRREVKRLNSAIYWREQTAVNMAKDAMLIACNELGMVGPKRAKKLCDLFDATLIDMMHMVNDEVANTEIGQKEALSIEYTRAKIDERIKAIVGEANFQPFHERYSWREINDEMNKVVQIK